MELQAVLAHPFAPPSHPRAVALLLSELGLAEPSLRRLNQFFGSDPALAARLLQQANGPAFALVGRVVGIPEALLLLGGAQLRSLVGQAQPGSTSRSVPGVNLQQFWRYSLTTAKLARALAGHVHQSQVAAYAAGLLHGLGELLLYLAAPERMATLDSMVGPFDLRRLKMERRLLGYSYAHVSAHLARHWQLPHAVVDALLHHGAPLDNEIYEPLAGVLHLASWRARAREAGLGERELAVSFPGEIGVALGLDIDMVLQQDPIDWRVPLEEGEAL